MAPNTKYAVFLAQAQAGLEHTIKTKQQDTTETVPPLVQLLRKLLEDDDEDDTDK